VIIAAWRRHFNAVRPHSSLAYLTTHEFKLHHPIVHDQLNRAISEECVGSNFYSGQLLEVISFVWYEIFGCNMLAREGSSNYLMAAAG
jgi:hypothetical protein